jgi:rare lipoprotein A
LTFPRLRRLASLFGLAAGCGLAVASASVASASNGGTAAPTPEEPGDPTVRLSANRVAYVGRAVRIRGSVENGRGHEVRLEARDAAGGWSRVATVRAGAGGAFSARWSPSTPGRFALRAVVAGASSASSGGTDTRSSAMRPLTVYRLAMATWYGPGFYGNRTACGVRLTRITLGVAHRSLPCGTQVELAYRGRTLTVPVIDRGPYARGIDWDLTSATAQRLGFTTTSRVGAVAIDPAR